MKRLLTILATLLLVIAAEAKIVKITLADGTVKVYPSAQLQSIEFLDDGTLQLFTYQGEAIELPTDVYDEVEIDDEMEVYNQVDTLLVNPLGKDLGVRQVVKVDYYYPSVDPQGEPTTLSATMIVPKEIWDGEQKSDGIILSNRFTATVHTRVPTAGFLLIDGFYLTCSLNLNYILVSSDFYGFGATARYPQAFCQGSTNGYASIHALLEARKLLDKQSIDQGPFLFNIGYSGGGFDCMATQKVRDMEYRDEVWFDKSFAGGGPYDLDASYRAYVNDDLTDFMVGVALTVSSTNECQKLGLDYSDLFVPAVGRNIPEWVLTKHHDEFWINDQIGAEGSHMADLLGPKYRDLNTPESQAFMEVLREQSLTTGWKPDPTQKIYLQHSRDDNYVPYAGAKPLLEFLLANGYKNNIYAGRTNLQSNFVFKKLNHLEGAVIYILETLFALKAWPTIYNTDHTMKPEYAKMLAYENDLATVTIDLLKDVGIEPAWLKDLFGKLMAASESAEGNPALDFSNDENTEAQTGSSLKTLLDLVNTYFSLMPADEAEEKAMDHDCGTSAKVYIRRLRHLLVVMGLL
jgi:hypothetical protein